MATMNDYEYHYPLTPIQSASHNIHPAFRNDPEFADLINVDENINVSTTTLVPPPRNPLRLAVKPLFSATARETNPSSPSPVQSFGNNRISIIASDAPEVITSESPISSISPCSPRSHFARTPSSQTSYKEVHDSSPLPPYEEFDTSARALNAPEPISSLSSLPEQQQQHHQQTTTPLPLTPSTSTSTMKPSTYTARTLSSLPCPPSLLPQEWSLFLRDLQTAAALSKTQKTLAVAVALAVPCGCPLLHGLVLWGAWRYQTVKNIRLGLEDGASYTQKRGKESVESVVRRWNEMWEERGAKVNLEVRGKGSKKVKGEKGRLRVVVSEFEAPKYVDGEGYDYDSEEDVV